MNQYTLEFLASALRELGKLPPEHQRRVAKGIQKLKDDPRPANCTNMVGWKQHYRIRIGEFRVCYKVEDQKLLITVVTVGDRKEIYG